MIPKTRINCYRTRQLQNLGDKQLKIEVGILDIFKQSLLITDGPQKFFALLNICFGFNTF